jgi:hypothetical protein
MAEPMCLQWCFHRWASNKYLSLPPVMAIENLQYYNLLWHNAWKIKHYIVMSFTFSHALLSLIVLNVVVQVTLQLTISIGSYRNLWLNQSVFTTLNKTKIKMRNSACWESILVSFMFSVIYAECCYADCRDADCRGASLAPIKKVFLRLSTISIRISFFKEMGTILWVNHSNLWISKALCNSKLWV